MRRPSRSLLLPLTLIATSAASAQAPQPPQARLLQALQANRLPLTMSDGRPAGPGWDWLAQEVRNARFTLIGEEHGVAETAQLAAALFMALRASQDKTGRSSSLNDLIGERDKRRHADRHRTGKPMS